MNVKKISNKTNHNQGGTIEDQATRIAKEALSKGIQSKSKGVVAQAKAKADAAGLGGVFAIVENIAEAKLGMDLDGDGDTGR